MTIAIETKYIGPTNTRPSRIVATTANGQRVVMTYNTACDSSGNKDTEAAHRYVAEILQAKAGWPGKLIAGGTKAGYVFVFADKE